MTTNKKSALKRVAGAKNRPRILDARPDRFDFRDLPYRPPLASLPPSYPADDVVAKLLPNYVKAGLIRDQGTEGACTGFGLAAVANYLFWIRKLDAQSGKPFESVSPRMLFELAKRYDEWPGTDYEGSSCRGALKGWHKHGVCSESFWQYTTNAKGEATFKEPRKGWDDNACQRPLGVYYRIDRKSIVDVQAAIFDIGAVYASATVHDGWDTLLRDSPTKAMPRKLGDLDCIPWPTRGDRDGHAFALVGYNELGFVVQNSWGERWGSRGFAILPYDDWIVNVTDVWAVALGAPVRLVGANVSARVPLRASRWRVPSGQSLTSLERSSRNARNPANDPWPVDHDYRDAAAEPWTTDEAYRHTLVCANEGTLVQTDFTKDVAHPERLVEEVVVSAPLDWLMRSNQNVLNLAIYAHGGLNSESDSIERIRMLGPYFAGNGVYPLFVTWKTGAIETLNAILQDHVSKQVTGLDQMSGGFLDDLLDQKDRAVEAVCRVVARGLWTEMRENAAGAASPGHTLSLLAAALSTLHDKVNVAGKSLRIHLIGHSAGSILLGHLLPLLKPLAQRYQAVPGGNPLCKSVTLWAPACAVGFANRFYGPADDAGIIDLSTVTVSVLSDRNERDDGLPSPSVSIYGRSLLYLVSRALDDVRKIPLLGMEKAYGTGAPADSDTWDESQLKEVKDWQARWHGRGTLRVVTDKDVRISIHGATAQATHGSFDNNVQELESLLLRISGAAALTLEIEWLDY